MTARDTGWPAVVLAAGAGTRLRSLTGDRPKTLLEVDGRPILEHCFQRLRPFHPNRFLVVVGWGGSEVIRRFGSGWEDVPIEYVHQEERLGLAHALATASPRLSGPFLAMHGDVVFHPRVDLIPVVERFGGESVVASILTERVEPRRLRRGAVRVDDEGAVRALTEHPGENARTWGRVAAGFYAFAPAVLDACRSIQPSHRGEYELPDALALLLEEGRRILARDLEGERVNVNTPEDLARARAFFDTSC
jgi:dTDP-glucose pyrophosphorylase